MAGFLKLGVAVMAATLGCAHAPKPPSPDQPTPRAPDLTGRQVMVLPAQPGPSRADAAGAMAPSTALLGRLDADIADALGEHLPRVRWVLPPALEHALSRAPSLEIPIHGLAVAGFRSARIERIGDPLFGDLRRLGALVDARYALVPVAASVQPAGSAYRLEIAAALIDTLGGAVLWYGVVAGEQGTAGSPVLPASAAQSLALALQR